MVANNRQRTQPLRVRLLFITIIISWVYPPPNLFLIGCTVLVVCVRYELDCPVNVNGALRVVLVILTYTSNMIGECSSCGDLEVIVLFLLFIA